MFVPRPPLTSVGAVVFPGACDVHPARAHQDATGSRIHILGSVACAPGPAPLALRPAGPSPAAVYLASLAEGSQPTQRAALRAVALILGQADPQTLPWHQLHYAHVAALRALRLVDGHEAPIQGT